MRGIGPKVDNIYTVKAGSLHMQTLHFPASMPFGRTAALSSNLIKHKNMLDHQLYIVVTIISGTKSNVIKVYQI